MHQPRRRSALLVPLTLLTLVATGLQMPLAHAATFTVTTTSDSGAGSLRQAIIDANASSGGDTIKFGLTGGAPYMISVGSALDPITDSLVIDGTSQTEYAGAPVIQVDGSLILPGPAVDGFVVDAAGVTITGLSVTGFSGNGVRINVAGGGGTGHHVDQNYIGLTPDGTARGNGGAGVLLADNAPNTFIGPGNVISTNAVGVRIVQADDTTVIGNKIGTDPTGATARGNLAEGIRVVGTSNTSPSIIGGAGADGNVISGNGTDGVFLEDAESMVVQGNLIGTNANGDAALANGAAGIQVFANSQDATDNQILGNVVAGNTNEGILLNNSAPANSVTGTVIASNFANVSDDGTTLIPNGSHGISVSGAGGNDGTVIGGSPAEANIVRANGTVASVRIATGNAKNAVRRNSITSSGVATPALQIDAGANNNQAAPTLNTVTDLGGSSYQFNTTVTGPATSVMDVDYFESLDCTESSQSETFLGSDSATTNGGGTVTFDTVLTGVTIPSGHVVSAIATDPAGNSSNISACEPVSTSTSADLSVSLTGLVATEIAGQPVDFTVAFKNLGPNPASNVDVTVALPTGAELVSANPSSVDVVCVDPDVTNHVVCSIDPFASSGAESVDFTVRTSTTPADGVTFAAAITSTTAEANPGDETDSAMVDTTDASPGFAPARSYDLAGAGAHSVAEGDLDGTNGPDLVVTSPDGTISAFLNNGDGTFEDAISKTVGGAGTARAIVMGQFDSGTTEDVVVVSEYCAGGNANCGQLTFLPGDGNGHFGAAQTKNITDWPRSIAAADLNSDGNLDIVAASAFNGASPSTFTFMAGDGTGGFANATSIGSTGGRYGIAIADVDGDGKDDVLTTSTSQLSVFRRTGNGTFAAVVNYPVSSTSSTPSPVLFDANDDGITDVAVSGNAKVLVGNVDGTFQAASEQLTSPNAFYLAKGDFNNDGQVDLEAALTSPAPGSPDLQQLRGRGDGTFSVPAAKTVTLQYDATNSIAAHDLNADGITDLIVPNGTDDKVTVLLAAPVVPITDVVLDQPASAGTGFAHINADDIDFSKIDLLEGTTETSGGPLSAPIPAKPIPAKPIPAKPIPAKPIPAKPIPAKSLIPGLPDPLASVKLSQVIDHTIPNPPSLTQIGIKDGWAAKLANTPIATTPIQNLTFNDAIVLPIVKNTKWVDFDFSQTVLGALPPSAFLYGETPLSSIGLPAGPSWSTLLGDMKNNQDYPCTGSISTTDLSQTLVDLAVARCPIAYAPWDGMLLKNVNLTGSPLHDFNFSGIDVTKVEWKDGATHRSLAGILLSDLASQSSLVDCAALGGCSGKTLGDAQAAEAGGTTPIFKPTATFGMLFDQDKTDLGDLRLGQLLFGIIPADAFPFENVPLPRIFEAATPSNTGAIEYTLSFNTICPLVTGTTATVDLPDGTFGYVPDSAEINGTPAEPTVDPQTGALSWDVPAGVCPGTSPVDVEIVFKVQPSPTAGSYVAHARIETGDGDVAIDESPQLTLTDSTEPNDSITQATPITPGSLVPATMAISGDVDYYKVDTTGLTVGSLVTLYLSHMQADDDLVLYGSVPQNLSSAPIPAKPIPAKSVGDQEGCLPSGYVLEPQTLDTVPALSSGSFAVRGFSTNRSDQEEVVCTTVQPGDIATGYVLLQATYHGAITPDGTSPSSTVLARATVTPPAIQATCHGATLGSTGSTHLSDPNTITSGEAMPAGTDALFVINEKRFGDLYGSAAETATLAKIQQLINPTNGLVDGQILAIDSYLAVAAAYGANPDVLCDPDSANLVVKRINEAVDDATGGTLPPNIVIVGSDDVVPFARLQDLTTLGNQVAYAPNLVLNNFSNPTAQAMARGMLMSDGPYATRNPMPYFGNFVYIPEVAIGRLVETPLDIQNAIDQFIAFDGKLDPKTALVTSTDFSTPAGNAIASDLQARATDLNARTTGDPYSVKELSSSNPATGWTRAQLICRLNGNVGAGCGTPAFTPPGLISVNGHFDHFRTLPGNEDVNDLVTTQDFLNSTAPNGTLLFTIGCNSGVNIPDAYVTVPGSPPNPALDWPQALAKRNGQLVANTGFGYGDTTRLAYSERLMKLFSSHLDGAYTIGDALMVAKGEYVGELGVYSTVDFKSLQESTLYGLPMLEITGRANPDDERERNTQADADTGLQAFNVSEPRRGDDYFVKPRVGTNAGDEKSGDTGKYYVGPSAITAPGYPIEPKSNAFTMTAKNTDLRMHGAIVTELSTADITGFNPVIAQTSLAGFFAGFEPPVQSGSFPTDYLNINNVQGMDFMVMYGGRFSANPNTPGLGTQRVYTKMSARGYYVNKSITDFTPPAVFSNQGELVAGTSFATFRVQTETTNIKAVYVMYRKHNATDFTLQHLTGGSGLYTADVSAPTGIDEFFTMVVDQAGNVTYDTFKGATLGLTTANTTPPAGVTVTTNPTLPAGGWFGDTSSVNVTIQSRLFTFITAKLDGVPVASTFGTTLHVIVPPTAGIHRIDYTVGGASAVYLIPIDGAPPTFTHSLGSPSYAGTYVKGTTQITVQADDPNGVQNCQITIAEPNGTPHTRNCTGGTPETFTLSDYGSAEGPYTISGSAKDNNNNGGSGLDSFQLIRDETGANATGSVPGTPQYPGGATTYVTSATDLRVTTADPNAGSEPGSGVGSCATAVTATGPVAPGGGGPVLNPTECAEGDNTYRLLSETRDGPYRFSTTMTDNVANGSANTDTLDVTLDNTPPEFAQCPTVDAGVSGTLASGIAGSATARTLTVNETASPPHVNFVITVSTAAGANVERMLVTNRVRLTGFTDRYTYTVQRLFGATTTTPPAHVAGEVVRWDPSGRQDLLGTASSATGTGTSLSLTGAKFGMPAAPFFAVMENEQMLVTAVAGTAPSFTLTVVRGYGGSSPASHTAGKSLIWSGATYGTVSSVTNASTIKVLEGKYAPPAVPFEITIGSEHLTVVRRDSPVGNVWTYTVARGVDGTKVVTPSAGTLVVAPPTSAIYLNRGTQPLTIPVTDNVYANVTGSGINASAFTIGSAPVFSNQGFSGGALHVNLSPTAVGTFALRLSATDNLGNTSVNLTAVTSPNGMPPQQLCLYEVIYKTAAFAAPVANDSVNASNAGQGVAVKWRITDYNGVAVTDSNTFVEITTSNPKPGTCDTVPEWTVALEGFKGGSNLQNLGGGSFQFNWAVPKTPAYAGTCRTMALRLAASGLVGPQSISMPSRVYQFANFNFKK
jgi:uncharacterized repeat protein (TIGR01451 family)